MKTTNVLLLAAALAIPAFASGGTKKPTTPAPVPTADAGTGSVGVLQKDSAGESPKTVAAAPVDAKPAAPVEAKTVESTPVKGAEGKSAKSTETSVPAKKGEAIKVAPKAAPETK
jgi:hypothetical protein